MKILHSHFSVQHTNGTSVMYLEYCPPTCLICPSEPINGHTNLQPSNVPQSVRHVQTTPYRNRKQTWTALHRHGRKPVHSLSDANGLWHLFYCFFKIGHDLYPTRNYVHTTSSYCRWASFILLGTPGKDTTSPCRICISQYDTIIFSSEHVTKDKRTFQTRREKVKKYGKVRRQIRDRVL